MITASELLELETLLKEKFESHYFENIPFDAKTNQITISHLLFIPLIEMAFLKEQYQISNDIIHIDINLFKILQSRYFPQNRTINFVSRKGKLKKHSIE